MFGIPKQGFDIPKGDCSFLGKGGEGRREKGRVVIVVVVVIVEIVVWRGKVAAHLGTRYLWEKWYPTKINSQNAAYHRHGLAM